MFINEYSLSAIELTKFTKQSYKNLAKKIKNIK